MASNPFELLHESWSLYRKHLWSLVGYSAWMLLPVGALFLLTFAPDHWLVFAVAMLCTLSEIFLALWMTIAITHSVNRLSQKQEVNHIAISHDALIRLPTLLKTAVLQGLVVIGGLLLFIVPGVIFAFWYAFAQLSTILDGKRPVEALTASKELVKGRFWTVAWRLIAGPIFLALVYSTVIGLVFMLVASLTGVDRETLVGAQPPDWVTLIDAVGQVFLIPLLLVYSVLLYQDLKKHPVKPLLDKSCDVA
ncbi:hypothetical protein HZA87_04425 [Candidatus Uhrbacteria bacterium]|nr:hypothetical protein [Candidatus Uhrbacteria bacterium]